MKFGFMAEPDVEVEKELMQAGCDFVFEAKGNDTLKEFKSCLKMYRGDTMVIFNFTSICPTINVTQITHILNELGPTQLQIIDQGTKNPIPNEMYLEIVKTLGNHELKVIRERTIKGLNEARINGQQMGRPKISNEKIERMQYLHLFQRKSIREIASSCKVSVGTVHKYVTMVKTS